MKHTQGYSKCTSNIAFEVLIINCQIDFINVFIFNPLTSNINLFNFNYLTSNFCFPKSISFANRRERLFMDPRPYFWVLNSPRKMMTCYLRDNIKFLPHPVLEYTRMWIPDKRYRTNTARTFRGTADASATKCFGLDHFGKYGTKICGIPVKLWNKKT